MILANVPYPYKATTLTFVDISILDRSDLELILESFPEADAMLRRRAKRKSLCQRMIRRGLPHRTHSFYPSPRLVVLQEALEWDYTRGLCGSDIGEREQRVASIPKSVELRRVIICNNNRAAG